MYILLFLLLFISSSYAFETTSDEISFDLNSQTCVLNGNSEIKFGQTDKNTFKANQIKIEYQDKSMKKPKMVKAEGNIHFYNKDISITSDSCSFDMICIEFHENVVIKNAEFGEIIADRAIYNIETKRIAMTAKKKVKMKVCDKKTRKLKEKLKK
jgi:lipopolysaccharide export system protein LptA